MMHMVPSYPAAPSSTSSSLFLPSASPASDSSSASSSSFDFDLDLLDYEVPGGLELPFPADSSIAASAAVAGGGHQQVPSPTNALSPIEAGEGVAIPHSPTMFSPADPSAAAQKAAGAAAAGGKQSEQQHATTTASVAAASASVGGRYAPLASPVSLPPASPYSPISCQQRGHPHRRLSSTDSARTCSSTTSSSSSSTSTSASAATLQESLAEFQELQNRIKQERDASIHSPPPYPGSPKSSVATTTTTRATMQIKIEPLESTSASSSSSFGLPPPPPAYSSKSRQEPAEEEGGQEADVTDKMEPVMAMDMEHIKKDIAAACKIMGISPSEYYY